MQDPQTVASGETIVFDGRSSIGASLRYTWRQLSGPVKLFDGEKSQATFDLLPINYYLLMVNS